jgi:hypothetical protein
VVISMLMCVRTRAQSQTSSGAALVQSHGPVSTIQYDDDVNVSDDDDDNDGDDAHVIDDMNGNDDDDGDDDVDAHATAEAPPAVDERVSASVGATYMAIAHGAVSRESGVSETSNSVVAYYDKKRETADGAAARASGMLVSDARMYVCVRMLTMTQPTREQRAGAKAARKARRRRDRAHLLAAANTMQMDNDDDDDDDNGNDMGSGVDDDTDAVPIDDDEDFVDEDAPLDL